MKEKINGLVKNLDEKRKYFLEAKNVKVKNLERASEELKLEFEKKIEVLRKRKDLIKEAIARKIDFKKWKISVLETIFPLRLRLFLSAPVIYSMFIPGFILDFFLVIYQNVCFRLYGIPLVKRNDHFIIDRHLLGYLNIIEKVNCIYCGYFNGLISYSREVAGRTERYWCPIKHAKRLKNPHDQYANFFDYLDAESFRKKRFNLRKFLEIKEEKGEE